MSWMRWRSNRVVSTDWRHANQFIQQVSDYCVADPDYLRWWQSLKVPAVCLSYDGADGLTLLAALVSPQREAILIVTDDETPPWPVYAGEVRSLLEILRAARYFEYILAAHDLGWVIFDTHMNELVMVGLSAEAASDVAALSHGPCLQIRGD